MEFVKKLISLSFWLIPIVLWVVWGYIVFVPIASGFLGFISVLLFLLNVVITIIAIDETGNIISMWK